MAEDHAGGRGDGVCEFHACWVHVLSDNRRPLRSTIGWIISQGSGPWRVVDAAHFCWLFRG